MEKASKQNFSQMIVPLCHSEYFVFLVPCVTQNILFSWFHVNSMGTLVTHLVAANEWLSKKKILLPTKGIKDPEGGGFNVT